MTTPDTSCGVGNGTVVVVLCADWFPTANAATLPAASSTVVTTTAKADAPDSPIVAILIVVLLSGSAIDTVDDAVPLCVVFDGRNTDSATFAAPSTNVVVVEAPVAEALPLVAIARSAWSTTDETKPPGSGSVVGARDGRFDTTIRRWVGSTEGCDVG